MFDTLSSQPGDPLLNLIDLFRADRRAEAVDLGVGVYRDQQGRTPIFRAVKQAERRLWEGQTTKSYVGPAGDAQFLERLWTLVGGRAIPGRLAAVQTPGGSGALRLAADLVARCAGRRPRVWLGLPSWPNHAAIIHAAGLGLATYPFFDVATQRVLFDSMASHLESAAPGDVVLLQASCHNPTGAVLSEAQWRQVTDIVLRRGLLPLVDVAYQGLGAGLEADVAGLRHLLGEVPEALVAVSASKSFGLYRERTGAIFTLAGTASAAVRARDTLVSLARVAYSMPPDHGAAVVSLILGDAVLRQDWERELAAMRRRVAALRLDLADGLAAGWPALAAVAGQQGMFSLLPLDEAAVLALRDAHGLYMPGSGRINVAGLRDEQVAPVAALIAGMLEAPAHRAAA